MAQPVELIEQALADLQRRVGIEPKIAETAGDAQAFEFPEFAVAEAVPASAPRSARRHVRIELGKTRLAPASVAGLSAGSLVPLDRAAGDPVDLVVDGRLYARGELLNLNGTLCVRICELAASRGAPDPERSCIPG